MLIYPPNQFAPMSNEHNTSGSIELPSTEYNVKGNDRIMSIILRELDTLKKKVVDIETNKIISETQLPQNILEENNLFPRKMLKFNRGRGYRPPLKSEIEEAQKHTVNESAAARWIGLSGVTYRKYAKLYGIYNPKPNIKGKRGVFDPNRGKYPLTEILQGKHPNVASWDVKDKLFRSGMKKLECEMCGFNHRRPGDNKLPLLLNHIDGDVHNHTLENLKILCFNCTFVGGRGYLKRGKYLFDPEWIQDAYQDEWHKDSRY